MNRIRGLDGLRGFAAISVVLTHYGLYLSHPRATLGGIFHAGAGLPLFFVLSGFLITLLLVREQQEFRRVDLKLFYLRRAFRIFPVYIVFLLLVSAIDWFVQPVATRWSLLLGWTYLYNFVPVGHYNGLQGHTWSLAVEEHFYLIWPALFAWCYPRRRNTLMIACVFGIAISALLRPLLNGQPSLHNGFFPMRWTVVAGGDIAMGCLAALVLMHGPPRAVTFLGSLFALLASVALWMGVPFSDYMRLLPLSFVWAVYLARTLGFALLLIWIYLNQGGWLTRVLEFPPFRYVGIVSYGLYVYQGFFLSSGPGRTAGEKWPPDPTVGLVLLCLVVPLSYHAFEERLTRFARRYRQATGPTDAGASGQLLRLAR